MPIDGGMRFRTRAAKHSAELSLRAARIFVLTMLLILGKPNSLEAAIIFEPKDLRESVRQADAVIFGTIVSRSRQTYVDESGAAKLCGTNYEIQTVTNYKGKPLPIYRFSTYSNAIADVFREAAVGDEMLVLLKFHSQPYDPARSASPDVVQAEASNAKQRCLRQLSSFSTSDLREGAFLVEGVSGTDKSTTAWLTYFSTRTLIPDCVGQSSTAYEHSCKSVECTEDPRRRILWAPLEKAISDWAR